MLWTAANDRWTKTRQFLFISHIFSNTLYSTVVHWKNASSSFAFRSSSTSSQTYKINLLHLVFIFIHKRCFIHLLLFIFICVRCCSSSQTCRCSSSQTCCYSSSQTCCCSCCFCSSTVHHQTCVLKVNPCFCSCSSSNFEFS